MDLSSYGTLGLVLVSFALAAIASRTAHTAVRRVLAALDITDAQTLARATTRGTQLARALSWAAFGIAGLAVLSLALERLGIDEPRWHPRQITHWILTHGVNIALIAAGAFIAIRGAHLLVEYVQHSIARRHAEVDLEWHRRASTLHSLLARLVTVSIGFIAVLMVLRELSIDVMPILTGAGIAGLAIGFGAQNLVRDMIAGFFLILEDQVRIGDLARINGITGTIEQISLRTIVLRDGEGAVQVFPNGTITTLANLSKQFAYAVVDMGVAYGENVDRVVGTIREVADALQQDAVYGPLILAPVDVVAVESLAGGLATIRARLKTLPLNQKRIEAELRRRLMTTFVGRGIRPYAG
jgi:small conductance mechanosensitive channel